MSIFNQPEWEIRPRSVCMLGLSLTSLLGCTNSSGSVGGRTTAGHGSSSAARAFAFRSQEPCKGLYAARGLQLAKLSWQPHPCSLSKRGK